MPPSLGLEANPYQSVPPLTVDPDLYKQLVEAALAREKEDMGAAIGTLLDGLRGMLGSVSYGVLRSADVPVLIAKEAEKE